MMDGPNHIIEVGSAKAHAHRYRPAALKRTERLLRCCPAAAVAGGGEVWGGYTL